jgi:prepilin-type N-terminal cleavage/methylation domain-containing protein
MTRRGFTLLELMTVLTILPIVAGAVALFHLEARIASARIEGRVALSRSLSLAHERLARDLRGATRVTAEADAVRIARTGAEVCWRAAPDGLRRSPGCGEEGAVVGRYVKALRIEAAPGGHRVVLEARRALTVRRQVQLERSGFVARRR